MASTTIRIRKTIEVFQGGYFVSVTARRKGLFPFRVARQTSWTPSREEAEERAADYKRDIIRELSLERLSDH